MLDHDDLAADARGEAPEELPVGLVALLDEGLDAAGALVRLGRQAGPLATFLATSATVMSWYGVCAGAVEGVGAVVAARTSTVGARAELGLDGGDLPLEQLVGGASIPGPGS